MTEIRWKNGGPLFLQPAPGSEFGLVATDQDCCCPPPPPERCWCPDLCSYFIELVEPSVLAVKHPPYVCGGNPVSQSAATDSLIPGLLSFEVFGFNGASVGQSSSVAMNTGSGLGVNVRHVADGFHGYVETGANRFYAEATASIGVFCSLGSDGDFRYLARITLDASFLFFFESLGFVDVGAWVRSYRGDFELPTGCFVSPLRTCFPYGARSRHIATFSPITVNGDGTTSLGNLSLVGDGGFLAVPPDYPYARDAVNDILGGLNYTFKLTARQACRTVECECDALLRGLPLEFEGYGYTIGTEVEEWTNLGQSEGIARYAYGSGEQNWTVRHEKTDGFNLQVFNRRQLDIYCEQTVDGPVWRALIRTYCYEPNAVLEDTWMGRFLCYKTVCEDLENNRPLDGPIPQEEPVEVEYLGRTYFGTSEPTCTPPPRPAVLLGQNTSC